VFIACGITGNLDEAEI